MLLKHRKLVALRRVPEQLIPSAPFLTLVVLYIDSSGSILLVVSSVMMWGLQ